MKNFKKRHVLAIFAALFFFSFFQSCENEILNIQPDSTTNIITEPLDIDNFLSHSKKSIKTLNAVFRDDATRSITDSTTFEEKWGTPNYDRLTQVNTSENNELLIVPLENLETGITHNVLVGWQENGDVKLRIVHDNRVLTSQTAAYTPIKEGFEGIFGVVEPDYSVSSTDAPVLCYEEIGCFCEGCIYCVMEVPCQSMGISNPNTSTDNSGPGGGGGPSGNNNTENNTSEEDCLYEIPENTSSSTTTGSGGGFHPEGETTNPDCYNDCSSCEPGADNPNCGDDCFGYYDLNCDGEMDGYEECVAGGGCFETCCVLSVECTENIFNEIANQLGITVSEVIFLDDLGLLEEAAQNQNLLELLIDNIDTPENLTLIEDGGILVSKTCESSFQFAPTGAGFTCQVNNISHTYFPNFGPYIAVEIPELCLQVSGADAFGTPLTALKAAELSAFAMDNARLALFDEIESGTIFTDIQAKYEYRNIYTAKLLELTGGQTTSSISYGACSGSIPTAPYQLNPLGGYTICITLW